MCGSHSKYLCKKHRWSKSQPHGRREKTEPGRAYRRNLRKAQSSNPAAPHNPGSLLALNPDTTNACNRNSNTPQTLTGSRSSDELRSITMSDTDSDTASSVGDIIEDASEADTTTFKCLFCSEQWSRVPDMFAHCKKEHEFDTEAAIKKLGQGQYRPIPYPKRMLITCRH